MTTHHAACTPYTIFFVHAGNIHTDALETYGPFPGAPAFTYEFMRESELGEHIFVFTDMPADVAGCPNLEDCEGLDHWHDSDGCRRNDGWRRCKNTNGRLGASSDYGFWTDLDIEVIPNDEGIAFDPRYNDMEKEIPA